MKEFRKTVVIEETIVRRTSYVIGADSEGELERIIGKFPVMTDDPERILADIPSENLIDETTEEIARSYKVEEIRE